jgi:hypothetical protein
MLMMSYRKIGIEERNKSGAESKEVLRGLYVV